MKKSNGARLIRISGLDVALQNTVNSDIDPGLFLETPTALSKQPMLTFDRA